MVASEDRLMEVIGDFEIYDGPAGPYVEVPDEDQISFEFIDPYELPGEVFDRLREISEEREQVREKAKTRFRELLQTRSSQKKAHPAEVEPVKTVPIMTVPIFDVRLLVSELIQTGGASFRGDVEGYDWDGFALDPYGKPVPFMQPEFQTGFDKEEQCDYGPAVQDVSYTLSKTVSSEQASSTETEADLMRGLTNYDDGSPHEPDVVRERPRLIVNKDVLSSDETTRALRLKQIFEDPRGHRRAVLIADNTMIVRLETLKQTSPQFTDLIDLYTRAALLSCATGTSFKVPPTVVLGAPGIGKTWIANQLATAIGGNLTRISMNTNSDSGMLFGHPQSWRGAKQGLLSRALVASKTASPILFLDEIDKLQTTGGTEDPYLPLLTLLESENAQAAMDEYLCVPFDLSHAIIIATANGLSALSAPLLDRLLVLEIEAPDHSQKINVARNILSETFKRFGNQFEMPSDDVIHRLAQTHPRMTIRLIELALGFLVQAKRSVLAIEDLEAADILLQYGNKASDFGFIGGRSSH